MSVKVFFTFLATFCVLCLLDGQALVYADEVQSQPNSSFDFSGRYKLVSSENYNEFLKELGIGYFKRLAATSASSEYVISKNDSTGEYTFKTIATFGDSEVKFKDGVQFDEARSDGANVKSTIKINGNKWEQEQLGDTTVAIVREFKSDGKIIVTSTANGVSSVRTYEKQN